MQPLSRRYVVTGVVCLVGGSLAVLAQWLVTPVNATASTTAMLRTVAEQHGAMGWALALDLAVLLVIPAVLFAGRLAGSGRSILADVATAVCFFPMLGSVVLLAFDALVYEAAAQPDRGAAVSLVHAFQSNAFVSGLAGFYLLTHVVGFVLLAVALRRAGAVPVWAAVALAVWPVLEMVGYASEQKAIASVGYSLLVVGYAACAMRLLKSEASAPMTQDVGTYPVRSPESVS